MNKTNVKKNSKRLILFLLVFVFCLSSLSSYQPKTVSAAKLTTQQLEQLALGMDLNGISEARLTSAQKAAKRNADRYCENNYGNEGLQLRACRANYVAGYLGYKYDGLSQRDTEDIKKAGQDERRRDFPETSLERELLPRGLCGTYLRRASLNKTAPEILRNYNSLNAQQKNDLRTVCRNGFNYSADYSVSNESGHEPECTRNAGAKTAACLAGKALAEGDIFSNSEITRGVLRSVSAEVGNIREREEREIAEAGEDGTNAVEDIDCQGGFGFGWVICPLFELGANMTQDVFDKMIRPMMENVPVRASGPFYAAWQNFRILGNLVLVGAMLLLVYGMIRNGGGR